VHCYTPECRGIFYGGESKNTNAMQCVTSVCPGDKSIISSTYDSLFKMHSDKKKIKYLGTIKNKNEIHEEIKSIINLENACYYPVQRLLSFCQLANNQFSTKKRLSLSAYFDKWSRNMDIN
jgi:hypothetical protein